MQNVDELKYSGCQVLSTELFKNDIRVGEILVLEMKDGWLV